jgi:DNA-binding transcriptional LysR family regulator
MKHFCYHSFDLRQLVSFAEIARTGSFRQAAKTLHIAQPALSRQIKQLEAALGIYLFDRAPRRLHLTIEGRELAGRLPALFSQIDYLTETVKGASTGGTGLLRIGDAGVLTTEVIAPALRRLRKHWPNLRLSAVQNTSEGFFHDLLENRIDCAFPALEPKGIDLTSHMLCKLEIGLVLPPDHRIATLVQTMTHLCIGGTSFHRLIRPTPMLDCYLVYRKNPSSPLLKYFISACLELGKDVNMAIRPRIAATETRTSGHS